MANQQHSSEIHVQLDDAQALQGIRALSDMFARMQQTAQQALQATGQTSTQQSSQRQAQSAAEKQAAREAREAEKQRAREAKEATRAQREEERKQERDTRDAARRAEQERKEGVRRVEREQAAADRERLAREKSAERDTRDEARRVEREQAAAERERLAREQSAERDRRQQENAEARKLREEEGLRDRGRQLLAQSAMAAAQAVASGSGSGLLSAGAQGLGGGLSRLGAGREGRMGTALRGLGAGLPVVGGLVGAALEARMGRVGDVMGLERPQTELVTGAGYSFDQLYGARAAGAGLGFTDAQTLATLSQVARGTQMRATLPVATMRALMQEELAGVSVGALSGFAGGGALGGGARGDVGVELGTALKLSATGRGMGLSGAGVERLLASVAQNTSRMAERGLTPDTESFGDFVTAVSAAAQAAGARQVMGVGAVRAAGRVTGMAQGALGQITGQFGGLGQSALLAAAGRGARSPLEMIANLEQLSGDPRAALAAMSGAGLRGDTLRMALVGGGASLAEAGALMGAGNLGMSAAGLSPTEQAQQARGMRVSTISAVRDNQLTRIVESDPASVKALMDLNATLEKMSLQMTRSDGVVVQTVEGVGAVMEKLLPAVEKLGDVTATLIRMFGGK